MENMVLADKIISEIKEFDEKGKIIYNSDLRQNDNVSVKSVFGLWKDRDIDKNTLRKKAWAKI
jgi:hypothetical protein